MNHEPSPKISKISFQQLKDEFDSQKTNIQTSKKHKRGLTSDKNTIGRTPKNKN